MMAYETVLSMWQAVRGRFLKSAQALTEEELTLKLGDVTIGHLLYHTGEVEYMFSDWYFGVKKEGIEKPSLMNKKELIQFLEESNEFLIGAMKSLSAEQWHEVKETKMGSSTPVEAIGRLIYHAGIHSGQVSDIKKYGTVQGEVLFT